jgi:hypothetical protein
MADGYTFPFLFSGAEHSALLHLKLIIDIMLACHLRIGLGAVLWRSLLAMRKAAKQAL